MYSYVIAVNNNDIADLLTQDKRLSGAPNENIVQNHLNIELLNYFSI